MRCDDCEGFRFGLIRHAGLTMNNLASSYSDLGRHADALAMFEQVLKIRRRELPANHPDLGKGCVGGDAMHAV